MKIQIQKDEIVQAEYDAEKKARKETKKAEREAARFERAAKKKKINLQKAEKVSQKKTNSPFFFLVIYIYIYIYIFFQRGAANVDRLRAESDEAERKKNASQIEARRMRRIVYLIPSSCNATTAPAIMPDVLPPRVPEVPEAIPEVPAAPAIPEAIPATPEVPEFPAIRSRASRVALRVSPVAPRVANSERKENKSSGEKKWRKSGGVRVRLGRLIQSTVN